MKVKVVKLSALHTCALIGKPEHGDILTFGKVDTRIHAAVVFEDGKAVTYNIGSFEIDGRHITHDSDTDAWAQLLNGIDKPTLLLAFQTEYESRKADAAMAAADAREGKSP